MNKKRAYRLLFGLFLVSIPLCMIWVRPLDSPWHRFIAGDGLGYYVYLPARVIYQDKHYTYTWFSKVYEKHYIHFSGVKAEDNFLCDYEGKKVNKYYPGLSVLWIPFFLLAHAFACVFQFPANGFSLPYQLALGAASIFYLVLALLYLRKLLFRMTGLAWAALLVPVGIFYGTNLFHYALNQNSLSHVYSFSMMVCFAYFAHTFFHREDQRTRSFLLSLFFYLILVSIRPLNAIALVLLPALANKGQWKTAFARPRLNWSALALAVLILWVVIRQLYILKTATASFFPNTYKAEYFGFQNAQFWRVSFSYQAGLFLYSPLLLLSFFGMPFAANRAQKVILPLFFLAMLYLYSCWWYWPIASRAMVDFYLIPAMLLAFLFKAVAQRRTLRNALICLVLILCAYHQLKAMQFRQRILDENYTHKELFWQNFFKWKAGHQYAIAPESVMEQLIQEENFEDAAKYGAKRSSAQVLEGAYAAELDSSNEYSQALNYWIPDFMGKSGLARIRVSFYGLAEKSIRNLQVYINVYSQDSNLVLNLPFYVKEESMPYGGWTKMEFGYELGPDQQKAIQGGFLSTYIWNNERRNTLYIDKFRTEFLLCDRSYEILP
ncbi:MAG TPA: hypothetical protein PLQ93_06125 [Bacteroidia bacterium]|nr:hypothetical protein [Bacteroidia bacterium]